MIIKMRHVPLKPTKLCVLAGEGGNFTFMEKLFKMDYKVWYLKNT